MAHLPKGSLALEIRTGHGVFSRTEHLHIYFKLYIGPVAFDKMKTILAKRLTAAGPLHVRKSPSTRQSVARVVPRVASPVSEVGFEFFMRRFVLKHAILLPRVKVSVLVGDV